MASAKSSSATRDKTKDISSYFKPDKSRKKRSAEPDDDDDDVITPPPNKKTPPPPSPSLLSNKRIAESKLWSNKLHTELGPSWMTILTAEFKKPYFDKLMSFVNNEREGKKVYPPAHQVFSWTLHCDLKDVKVVVMGQDPYHGHGQAHGLCFSVCVGVRPPPSLVNIYKELNNCIPDFSIPDHGYLIGWARQGVLLLNACLTVVEKQPNSHEGKGWEKLTDAVIHWINDNMEGVVFLLWGGYAHKKGSFINEKRHHVLKASHPSPLSVNRGFFGCGHFSKTNEILLAQDKAPIDWANLPKV